MQLRHILIPFIFAIVAASSFHEAAAMSDYPKAREILPDIFRELEKPKTLYCSCPLIFKNNTYYPNLKACNYQVRRQIQKQLASKITVEHIVPAWEFGKQFSCWKKGGRKRCSVSDELFMEMEGDLHNLYPSVGEVNQDRSNFRFSEWNATNKTYGKCQTVIDFKHRRVQPQPAARGIIARAYLYMQDRYGLKISKNQQKLFKAWDSKYPPDANECKRNELILKVQGNQNPFVSRKCKGQENLKDIKEEPLDNFEQLFKDIFSL